jgi:hypothetical protein
MGMPVDGAALSTQLPGKLLIPDCKPYVLDRLRDGPKEINYKKTRKSTKGTNIFVPFVLFLVFL